MSALGIVAALPAEARLFSRAVRCGVPVETSPGCLVVVSGMGAHNAAAAARSLVDAGARALVSWGVAGGLDPRCQPGHVLVPQTVISVEGDRYVTDQAWGRRVMDALCGSMACSDADLLSNNRVVASPSGKRRMYLQYGAAAVDLESVSVAALAAASQLPFVALRAVADAAHTALPQHVLTRLDAYGRMRGALAPMVFLRHPTELAAALAAYRCLRRALDSLRHVLRLLGHDLLAPGSAGRETPADLRAADVASIE